jgi:hypothetical protein
VKILQSTILLSLVVFMSACSNNSQQSSAPVLTDTPPAVATVINSATESAAAVEIASATSAPAAPDWFGIPIMPGALTGDGDEEGYVFLVEATVEHVRAFYEAELPKLGWEPLPGGDESTLLYMKTDSSASLTINFIAKGDKVMVLFAR